MSGEKVAASGLKQPNMPELVSTLLKQQVDLWWRAGQEFPDLGPAYSMRDKFAREALLDEFLDTVTSELSQPPRLQSERRAMQERLTAAARIFSKSALDLEDHHLDVIQNSGFVEAAAEFIRMARRFDPTLSGEDIYQASRNVWTMNLLQFLLGFPLQITPSVFAYSLLYPYSDNYLDNPSLSPHKKLALNERFARRLCGELLSPENDQEKIIFLLVGMIEDQYDRALYPQVHASLLAIHAAQTRSLRLFQSKASPYEVDILGISFEKGGTAVLADGYLVAGELNQIEREFMFSYGVFTQLMDDLEDVRRDMRAGQMTVFSQTAHTWQLDLLTNQTFSLGARMVGLMDNFSIPGRDSLQAVIKRGIDLLLVDSVGQMGRFYSRAYIKTIEAHLPFRFSYLDLTRKKLKRRHYLLSSLMDAFS